MFKGKFLQSASRTKGKLKIGGNSFGIAMREDCSQTREFWKESKFTAGTQNKRGRKITRVGEKLCKRERVTEKR